MFIERIKVNDHAILRDVTADFADINVVYGRNGTGKTLLSEIFRSAGTGRLVKFGTVKVGVTGASEVSSDQFRDSILKDRVRVFNRKFVEDNVFGADPAAIVVGGEVQEERERVAGLQVRIDELSGELAEKREDRESKQSELDRFKTDLGREIRSALLPATKVQDADTRWSNFNKTDVDRLASEIGQDALHHRRGRDRLDTIIESIAEHSFPSVPEIEVQPAPAEQWIQRSRRLCSIHLVAPPLTEGIDNEGLLPWLDAGLKLMADSRVCPFCGQTVPDEKIRELSAYFTDQHDELMKHLKELRCEVADWLKVSEVPKLVEPHAVRANLRTAYLTEARVISDALESHRLVATKLQGLLERKQRTPSDVVDVDLSPPHWPIDSQERANELIRRHNDASEVVNLCEEFERAMVADAMPYVIALQSKIEQIDEEITDNLAESTRLVGEREDALARSQGEARAAAELSRRLTDFVGHPELSFSCNEDGSSFRLMRQNDRAEGLSEGERNAVGLVYFLMQLDDSRRISTDVALVLDDPVTSFDDIRVYDAVSEILYRTGTKGVDHVSVGQLFVFTHHIGLLDRLWRELHRKRDVVKFFELQSRSQGRPDGRRTELIETENPTRFRYHMAFEDVYLLANHYDERLSGSGANSIRVCLEGFLFARVPGSFASEPGLENLMRKVNDGIGERRLDPSAVHLICSVANAGSHDDSPDKPTNIEDELERYRKVAERLLQFIALVDSMHYNDMVEVCKKRLGRGNL